MDNEIVKHLLDIGFKLSTDGYIDSGNRVQTYPVLCIYIMENDYELWINYSKDGFTLNSIDFCKKLDIGSISEINTFLKILSGN